ncbi:hypothetical protein QBC47DRAFT_311965 [Echria macrotheca]|uniref:C2H2-type domain-containing protein n=1 Tax=Echria macrotheca TaxID=438768 RepID=A0AAJ0B0F1_9PEZI|nr:hypothetical protein QBC47DRAFT_311965 [Echria macrotheca]
MSECGFRSWDEADSQPSASSEAHDEDNILSIGTYAAEHLFGLGFEDGLPWYQVKNATRNFVNELLRLKECASGVDSSSSAVDADYPHVACFGSSSGGSSLKRKASPNAGFGFGRRDNDEESKDGKGPDRRGNGKRGPADRDEPSAHHAKPERLEFMCPYRLKDPSRFNVREAYDCATKSYVCDDSDSKRNELNELRRHIKQKHAGPAILAQPYCSTCKEEFPTAKLLDEHARRRECSYRELPSSDNPLDGLSPEAERALRSKKGRQGDTPLDQYRQICQIIFGRETEIPNPGRCCPAASFLGCPT